MTDAQQNLVNAHTAPWFEKKILVIEDTRELRDILLMELQRGGFKVSEAKNGKEGLQAALLQRPDLIVLNLHLPEMNGVEVLRNLRTDEWGKRVKIFVLTNYSDVGKVTEAREIGIDAYIVKSDWSIKDIVKKIQEALSH